jgi:hypothetical protein
MSLAGDVELFFVLAATDDVGAAAITQRIRERLEARDHVRQAGLIHTTSYRLLKTAKGAMQASPSEAMETYLKAMAVEIQELMNEELARRISPIHRTPLQFT